jgi:hypothetical protein
MLTTILFCRVTCLLYQVIFIGVISLELLITQLTVTNKIMQSKTSCNDMLLSMNIETWHGLQNSLMQLIDWGSSDVGWGCAGNAAHQAGMERWRPGMLTPVGGSSGVATGLGREWRRRNPRSPRPYSQLHESRTHGGCLGQMGDGEGGIEL